MSIKKYVLILFLNSGFLMSCQSSNQENTTEVDALNDEKEVVTEVALSFEQWFSNPKPLVSAHRGGPYPDFPENALETFQNIVDQIPSVIIECDVSMTKDSVLLLMHDKTLDRTTTSTGNVSDYNFEELKNLFLLDNQGDTTVFKIPTLDATLSWGKGKAMLTLDVKRGVPFERVISAIESYNATSYAAVITYRVEDAELVNKLNPDIVISVSAGSDEALERINISRIPKEKLLGFVGTSEPKLSHYEKLKKLGVKTILGTLGNLDKSAVSKGDDNIYLNYIKNGANIIATDRPLEVASVISATD